MAMAETEIVHPTPTVNTLKKSILKRIFPWALKVIGCIVLVGLLSMIVLGFIKINSMTKKITSLQKKISKLEGKIQSAEIDIQYLNYLSNFSKPYKDIDLTIPNIQDVNNEFKVARLSVKEHLTGIKVSGRMINSSSLDHTSVKFAITVNNNRREFTISRISAGNSTNFEVYIPNTPLDKSESGKIEYVESMIHYYTQ